MTSLALRHVSKQVREARNELTAYMPESVDWNSRAVANCKRLVPWLERHASDLASFLTGVMNSPNDVRDSVRLLLERIGRDKEILQSKSISTVADSLLESLDLEELLISEAGGTVVSKLIEKFLVKRSADWILESNGASDYPDLFIRDNDYSMLPKFQRGATQVYGAALKGKLSRPVRVPDELEVKTCRGTFAVDCHHAHAGLHLVVLFNKTRKVFRVDEIQIAFMRHDFYRITVPASPTTTLKASFNGQNFISILPK